MTIIDTRSESDIDNSAYPTEIISIADLKDAVETPCVVVADVYFDNGVTFLAVTSVDGKGQSAVDDAEGDGYNFVGDSDSASTIVFDRNTYKWKASGSLKGCNWTENGDNDNDTLVKAIDTKWGTVSAGNEYSVTLTVDGVDMTYTVVISA